MSAKIRLTVTLDELENIVNDYEIRLSHYEDDDGCDAYHGDDPIYRAFGHSAPCICSERTLEARATAKRLRAQLDKGRRR